MYIPLQLCGEKQLLAMISSEADEQWVSFNIVYPGGCKKRELPSKARSITQHW